MYADKNNRHLPYTEYAPNWHVVYTLCRYLQLWFSDIVTHQLYIAENGGLTRKYLLFRDYLHM